MPVSISVSAPALSVYGIRETTATLSLANHTAAWWYKGSQTGAACVAAGSGRTARLTGLTADSGYTYKAYSAAGCAGADELASVAFSTHADLKRPRLLSVAPADDATGVATNADLVLRFSEPVQKGTGNIVLDAAGGTTGDKSINVTSNQVAISGNTVTINPSTNLATSKNYHVRIPATAITDMAGNAYRGIADATTWNFQTASGTDTTAPTVSSYSPTDNGNMVRNSRLVLTFNKPVKKGTGNIVLNASGSTDDVTIAVTSSQVTVDGSKVIIIPSEVLPSGKAYGVRIAATAFDDLAGNSYAGISNDTTWNFTTTATLGGPANPSPFTATGRDRRAVLKWTLGAGIRPAATRWEYRLKSETGTCGNTGYGAWRSVGPVGPGGKPRTGVVVNKLSNGTRYCFQVRGVWESGTTRYRSTNATADATPAANTKPTVSFSNAAHTVAGGSNLSLTVTLSAALSPAAALTLPLKAILPHEGFAEGDEFTLPASVTIASGQTSGTFTLSTSGDEDEDDDRLMVVFDDDRFPLSKVAALRRYAGDQPLGTFAEVTILEEGETGGVQGVSDDLAAAPDAVDPDSIRVAHNGSSLSASWDAPARASHYDVTYYAEGQAHARAAWNREGTELTITCDVREGYENQSCVEAGAAYFVGLRARNAGGESAWIYSKSAAQAKIETVRFRDCATGEPVSGRLEVQAPSGAGALATLCYGPVSDSAAFSLGNFAGGDAGRARDAGAFTASTPDTVTAGGVSMRRTRITRKTSAPSWPLGPDGDGVWIFDAKAADGDDGEDIREIKVVAAGLWVADATANEPAVPGSASLSFRVEMWPPVANTVKVDYATQDGTAVAGSDYTQTSGHLAFAPGESSKTVEVPVLADAHDDSGETLTLTLAHATGAMIVDGEATGTITNDGPLQQAWLARFGRTVATHVTDAVGDRLRGASDPGSHLTVGGYRLPLGQQAAGQGDAGAATRGPALLHGLAGLLGLDLPPAGGTPEGAAGTGAIEGPGLTPGADPRLGQRPSVHIDLRRLLLGSSFRLALGADDAGASHPRLTAWGRVAGTTFDGQEGPLSLNGDVLTGTVGVDGAWAHWLAGVAVAHSRGQGAFTMPDIGTRGRGDLEQTLTSLHPYLRYAVNDRLAVWGLAGYGWGKLELDLATGETRETDTRLMMGAVGGRGILLAAPETGGLELATRTDAMLTRTSSDAAAGLAAADGDAHRLRLILEGTRGVTWADGRTLTPTVEVGLRHDWGDAETGFGLELGGRVQYADPRLGLTVEGAVRGLLAHEDRDYQEWGASGTLRVAPGEAGQGLSLTVAPTWGVASSGVEGLWARQTTAGLAPQGNRAARTGQVTAEVGYGVPAFDRGLLTPYAGTVLAAGADRTYRVGTRWTGTTGLTLTLEGTRQEPAGQQPVNQGVQVQMGWGF